jgi:hypothetical protein
LTGAVKLTASRRTAPPLIEMSKVSLARISLIVGGREIITAVISVVGILLN